jgi:hypothetical protein
VTPFDPARGRQPGKAPRPRPKQASSPKRGGSGEGAKPDDLQSPAAASRAPLRRGAADRKLNATADRRSGARSDLGSRPRRTDGERQRGERTRQGARAHGPAAPEPVVDEDVTGNELSREARAELRTASKGAAEFVSRHLVMAGRLVDEDPARALSHALAARKVLPRLATVREAVGLCAYASGEWAQALAELRASKRINGAVDHLPVMADCERGLRRPERALSLAGSADARRLDRAGLIEMRIVVAGARRDLGQLEAAVVSLQCADLDRARRDPWSARLFYAYADALAVMNRTDEAREWFLAAAVADVDSTTDAADRVAELDAAIASAADRSLDGANAVAPTQAAASTSAQTELVLVFEEPKSD